MTSKELAEAACRALDAKKGLDIVSINLEGRTIICDYFVICSGKNAPQVKALCDNTVEELDKFGCHPRSREGYGEGRWIILDYGDIVVHIFNDETRLFYHIEKLWAFGDNVVRYASAETPEEEIKEAAKKAPAKKPRTKKVSDETSSETETKKPRARVKKSAENAVDETETKPRRKNPVKGL